ncbi:hypothetical protein N0B44_25385 [Roseibacterium beibuensis]|uniref:hypothetical protein n=1 Tax=[Roseibacterium] beibuensis TaxID=1193142 RepID=UPI00217DA562|nr:hypothetical protein [Roseibacterium beibuensis]MCS6626257.1 hypothetical protein [Roseibacterium beibuensis]
MKLILLAASAAAIAGPAPAQAPLPDVPLLAGATAAPDCGNLYGLAGKAFCVSAPLAAVGALADAYVAELEGQGWLPAGGDDNRVVFVRRRDGGGCDGLQMQAFYDTSRPAGPQATGYLGFGVIPGDVCAAGQPGAGAAPETQQ